MRPYDLYGGKLRGLDEYGNMIWIPTGAKAVVEVSVVMAANGDTFTGKTNNFSRVGNTVIKTRSDGTTNSADVALNAKVAGVPVNFGNGFAFGEMSQSKNGQKTVITE